MPEVMFARRIDTNRIRKVLDELLPPNIVIEPGQIVSVPIDRLRKFHSVFPQLDIYFPNDADMLAPEGDFDTGDKRRG